MEKNAVPDMGLHQASASLHRTPQGNLEVSTGLAALELQTYPDIIIRIIATVCPVPTLSVIPGTLQTFSH